MRLNRPPTRPPVATYSSQDPLLNPTQGPEQHGEARSVPSPPSHDGRHHSTGDLSATTAADSTSRDKNEKLVKRTTHRPVWIPLALRRWLLVAFAVLFIALFVVVEVLFQLSKKNNGLSTNSSANHYLWTYGPTAVFIVISAVWGQIEYRTKQLLPWAILNTKAEVPQKSVLLDYISWWNVIVLFKAMRSSHWPVVLAILGTLGLQLITVASTGLLTLESVQLDHIPTTPYTQYTFDSSNYKIDQVDGRSAFTTVGIGWLNLAYPVGTSADHAFQPFNVSSDVDTSADSLITAEVDVFTPEITCEWGTVVNNLTVCADRACVTTVMELTVQTESCPGYYLATLENHQAGARGYFGAAQPLSCNDTSQGDMERVVFMAAHWVDTKTTDAMEVLTCAPSYTMTRQLVTVNMAGEAQAFHGNASSSAEASKALNSTSLPAMDLVRGILKGMSTTRLPFAMLQNSKTQDLQGGHFGTFFIVANLTSPHSGAEWMTRSVLEERIPRTLKSLMIQTTRQWAMQPAQEPLSGYLSGTRDRLVVRELSVRLMEATLIALVLVCGGLWFLRPVYSTPRDPGSILGQIIVLDRSPEFARTVAGITTEEKLKRETAGKLYKGRLSSGLEDSLIWSVDTLPVVGEKTQEATAKKPQKKAKSDKPPSWWQPWALNRFGRSLALVSPLLLIIGLELVYQLSHRWDGLGTIGANEYIHYTWVYVPAILMMTVRIVYEAIFSSAKIVQPYLHLKRGARIEDDAITDNPQAKLAIQSVWKGLSGHFGVAPAALATLIAPLLTIVASGLYSAESVQSRRDVQIHRADLFNSSISEYPSLAAQSSLVGGMIVTSGVAYPDWTYDELALSRLRTDSLVDVDSRVRLNATNIDKDNNQTSIDSDGVSKPSTNDTSFLQAMVPALRVNLNCNAMTNPTANWSLINTDGVFQLIGDFGEGCGTNINTSYRSVVLPTNTHVGGYFARYTGDGSFGNHDCVDSFLAWGYLPDDHSTDQIRAFGCTTSVDLLEANTTFLLPNYTITAADPVESTRKEFIPYYLSYYDFGGFLPSRNDTSKGYDEFWSAVMDGHGLTTDDFDDTDKVLKVVEHLYRVLLAQTMSAQARIPLDGADEASRPSGADDWNRTLKGEFVDPNVTRLKQSPISSRILEGLLAAMLIACVVSFHFLRTRDLLPLNPCSIAGASTYLASSQLVGQSIVPPGAEVQRKSDLLQDSRLAGLMLSLGWWSDTGGQKRYGVDIGKAE